MNISNLAAEWIEQHKDEIEDHGEDYSWIPGECASYEILEDVMNAFGQAGIKPFNLYQGDPANLYRYIWEISYKTSFSMFIPDPLHHSNANFQIICQTNAKIARALGLEIFKYKKDINPQEYLCPYIAIDPNHIQNFQDKYLKDFKKFLCSIKTSDYELVKEESEI